MSVITKTHLNSLVINGWPLPGKLVNPGAGSLSSHPVVRELDVALVVQEHFVQLQVPVDDAALV